MTSPISTQSGPPKRVGPLAKRERFLAYRMLLPTFLIVLSIVLMPLFANFWISFKAVELGDLRAAQPMINEQVKPRPKTADQEVVIRYRIRNSSKKEELSNVVFTDELPEGLLTTSLPENCQQDGLRLWCDIGTIQGGKRLDIKIPAIAKQAYIDNGIRARSSKPVSSYETVNVLTSLNFTLDNFKKIFSADEFWTVLRVSFYYTIFGTLGALVLGLFAAQILNTSFFGRPVLRGLFLFPYVAPVIAVAFAWVLLLDAGPGGTFNAMLFQMGLTNGPINFLGAKYIEFQIFGFTWKFPMALTTVIAFEAWRYFPLSFLFILSKEVCSCFKMLSRIFINMW